MASHHYIVVKQQKKRQQQQQQQKTNQTESYLKIAASKKLDKRRKGN